jgi:WD40 repeat protein
LHQALLASHLRQTLTQEEWGPVPVYDVAFSPDGAYLVTGVGNDTAVIWDLAAGQPVRTLSHPKKGAASVLENGVQSVAFSHEGTRLATAGADGEVKIWDADSGRDLTSLGRLSLLGFVYKVDLSPDGVRLATVSADGTPRVWDINSGQELFSLIGHNGTVRDVAFSPEGALLATGDDATAQIWDAASGEKLRTLSGHMGPVWGVAFSPDGTALATASADGTARVWDVSTGQQVMSLTGHTGQVRDVAFSPECVSPPDGGPERCGARLATAGADGTAKVWDLATGKQFLSLAGHTDVVLALAFSPEGTRLATASADGTVKLWDITPDHELLSFPSGTVYDMALSPEGARLATSSARGTATVWDLATGQELLTVSDQGHDRPLNTEGVGRDASRLVSGVAFSRAGKRLATAGSSQTAKVWDLATGQELLRLSPAGSVNAVAFSPDGKRLATTAEDSAVRIWDATSGEKVDELVGLHSGAVKHVVFSPECVSPPLPSTPERQRSGDAEAERCGALLASAGADGTAVIWDAATGWHLFRLSGHTSELTYAAFSPDGEQLATASRDTTVKIWDVHSGEELLTLSGHNATVNSVAFSPDGTRLASASADGTARVWDPGTGAELLSISTHPIGVGRVAFSHECVSPPEGGPESLAPHASAGGCGTRLITANSDNTVRIYLLQIDELTALARSRLTRGLTDEECQQYLHVERCPE